MSELSQALGTAGAPHQIVHDGRTYTFHLVDQVRKNALEKRFYQRARESVNESRDVMTPDEVATEMRLVREKYERGEYGLFSEYGKSVLQTTAGSLLLLEVITGESQDDVLTLLAACPQEVSAVLQTVLYESFRWAPKPVVPEVPGA